MYEKGGGILQEAISGKAVIVLLSGKLRRGDGKPPCLS